MTDGANWSAVSVFKHLQLFNMVNFEKATGRQKFFRQLNFASVTEKFSCTKKTWFSGVAFNMNYNRAFSHEVKSAMLGPWMIKRGSQTLVPRIRPAGAELFSYVNCFGVINLHSSWRPCERKRPKLIPFILRAWTMQCPQAVKHFTWSLSIFAIALTPPANFNFA